MVRTRSRSDKEKGGNPPGMIASVGAMGGMMDPMVPPHHHVTQRDPTMAMGQGYHDYRVPDDRMINSMEFTHQPSPHHHHQEFTHPTTGMERMTTRSHTRQLRSSNRLDKESLRDPATAQNPPMSSRIKSAFSSKK
jgi:hypothetical protein